MAATESATGWAGAARTLRALAGCTHPGPAAAVTAVAALVAIAAGLEPWRVALVTIVMGLDQISVGLSNDWLDVSRDRAVGRRDKPLARGDVSVGLVRRTAIATAALSLVIALALGPLAAAAHAVFLVSAWAYNTGLKRTALSIGPYLVSFGILPAIVTLAAVEPTAPHWRVGLAGALLGAAAHFANVLPDLDDDARTAVRGLPHRIGRRPSVVASWVALAGAGALLASAALLEPSGSEGAAASGSMLAVLSALAVLAGLTTAGLWIGLRRPSSRALFRLIIVAAIVDVALLIATGARIAA